jgi:transposase
MSQAGFSSPFLPLPDGIVIASIHEITSCATVEITCERKAAACPLCFHLSERVHGAYVRTVDDLPCAGRRVILKFTVRKFVCSVGVCPQKIFTERVPELVLSYARMTNRLREAPQELGFATCGEVGERLAPKLGMHVSGPTLLRHMRKVCCPPPLAVSLLGIDDWAWKRGQTYGTLLVDLDLHLPIELLPDRHASTVETCLRMHPEVQMVSRDRGGEYAAAARRGAPQTQQIADKFHLLKNLREALKDLMARHQTHLPEAEEPASGAIPAKAQGDSKEIMSLLRFLLHQKKTRPSTTEPSRRPPMPGQKR